jgi:hypothetical protein
MNKKSLKSIAYSGLVLALMTSSVCAMKKNSEETPLRPNKQINVPKPKAPTSEERIRTCQEKVGTMVQYCFNVCAIVHDNHFSDCKRSCETMNKNWGVCRTWAK